MVEGDTGTPHPENPQCKASASLPTSSSSLVQKTVPPPPLPPTAHVSPLDEVHPMETPTHDNDVPITGLSGICQAKEEGASSSCNMTHETNVENGCEPSGMTENHHKKKNDIFPFSLLREDFLEQSKEDNDNSGIGIGDQSNSFCDSDGGGDASDIPPKENNEKCQKIEPKSSLLSGPMDGMKDDGKDCDNHNVDELILKGPNFGDLGASSKDHEVEKIENVSKEPTAVEVVHEDSKVSVMEAAASDSDENMQELSHSNDATEDEGTADEPSLQHVQVVDPLSLLRAAEEEPGNGTGADVGANDNPNIRSQRAHGSRSAAHRGNERHNNRRSHTERERRTSTQNNSSSSSRHRHRRRPFSKASYNYGRKGKIKSGHGRNGIRLHVDDENCHPTLPDDSEPQLPRYLRSSPHSSNGEFGTTVLDLPMDAMHCISTYWTVKELAHFGLVNRQTSVVYQNIIRRIKMHAFKCAIEVATTWNRGEHADAKELAALYVHRGVPIYPAPLGHAYHTLHWRMEVEANSMKGKDDDDDDGDGDGDDQEEVQEFNDDDYVHADTDAIFPGSGYMRMSNRKTMYRTIEMRNGSMDRFYLERHEARNAGKYWHPSLTYLEEKGLFWKSKVCGIPTQWTREERLSMRHTFNIRPPPPPIADTFGFLGFMDEEEDFPNLAEQNRVIGIGENVAIGPGDPEFGHIPEIAAMRESDANFSNSHQRRNSRFEDINSLNEQEEEWRRRSRQSSYRSKGSSLKEENQNSKIVLHCHKHLVDRHLQGLPAISDELGNMNAEPLQLGADFFHPTLNRSYPFTGNFGRSRDSITNGGDGMGGHDYLVGGGNFSPLTGHGRYSHRSSSNRRESNASARGPLIVRSSMARPPSRRAERGALDLAHNLPAVGLGLGLDSSTVRAHSASLVSMLSTTSQDYSNPYSAVNSNNITGQYVDHCVIADLELHLYDSTSGEDYDMARRRGWCKQYLTSTTTFTYNVPMSKVRTMIPAYERRLHSLLQRGDYDGFDEGLLDFWDEFLPLTSHVHFYDQHTPVPRMSKLHRFLTRPCPKAWGTMQCEIQRIRVKYRTKGMMTGRYYSTYEYRLFIKDRRQDVVQGSHPRMDTVLMAAKYRGKHYSGPNGLAPVTNGKKGVNHYFLYMPHQSDMDDQYKVVNKKDEDSGDAKKKKKQKDEEEEDEEEGIRRYRQEVPAAGSILELCRLQTNYMGTEFQISSPCALKYGSDRCRGDQAGNDGNNASEANVEEIPSSASSVMEGDASLSTTSRSSKFNPFQSWHGNKFKKKKGGDDSAKGKMNKNTKSRFAARISPWSKKMSLTKNVKESSAMNSDGEVQPHFAEEREIGAITYTANVLGNRPRIMNVCIPKVCSETERPIAADDAWTKKPGEDGTMLSKLKDIQHIFHTNPNEEEIHPNNNNNNADTNTNNSNLADTDDTNQGDYGLTCLQNRPPWWNHDLGAFVLNFGGRVSVASVKNFQLCDRDDHDNIMLQFGRIEGRHSFTMDFSFPLSPVQAFAISISSLQSKISFA